MHYTRELKKKLCDGICLNGWSTLKTANEYKVPIKTLEKWTTAYNKDNHCFDPIIETVTDFRFIKDSDNLNYVDLSNDELKDIIMKKDINKKSLYRERRWYGKKVYITFSKKNTK